MPRPKRVLTAIEIEFRRENPPKGGECEYVGNRIKSMQKAILEPLIKKVKELRVNNGAS